MARGHWPQYSDSGCQVTCNPTFESLFNVFSKKAPFIFLPLTYNGEVAELTRPWVKDIKILRYTFYRYWYRYQLLKVSRWSSIQCSYEEHSNFFLRWGLLTWPGDLTLGPGSEILQHVRKRLWTVIPKTAALCTTVFLDIHKTTWRAKNAP